MEISVDLTREQFEEILLNAYIMGQGNERMKLTELIEEIKKQMLTNK